MKLFTLAHLALLATYAAAQGNNAATNYCPPLGPVLPPPRSPSTSSTFRQTMRSVETAAGELVHQLGFNATAISVAAQSIHETSPFLNLQITPDEFSPKGVHRVTKDTIFRIGSVSKVFTVLAILELGIPLSDPVTKYLPELLHLQGQDTANIVNPGTTIDWHGVTIDALTSQLAGISGQFGEDIANTGAHVTNDGLPSIPDAEHTECGGSATQRACTRADFFAKFAQRRPVYAPYTTPVYSNEAYALLGWVIEAVSNVTCAEYIQDHIFTPLEMGNSSLSKPDDSRGFIPVGEDYWPTRRGLENPSGGIYASTQDLLRFGTGILNNKLLPPEQTRQWLKPHTHTSSLGLSVGAPWEIARSDTLTADKRVVDFYTKTGGLGFYNAIIILVPDYDVVMTVMLAGPEVEFGLGTLLGVTSKLIEKVIPAVEVAGKEGARSRYTGIYGAHDSNDTLTVDLDDGPGLRVTRWTSRGNNILAKYGSITSASAAGGGSAPLCSIRLYPTGLADAQREAWRAVFTSTTPMETSLEDSMLFFDHGSCQSWSAIDENTYGLIGLDDFDFHFIDGGEHATAVTPRAFRQTLDRQT